jgi:alpha-tubulin suppressor-like RCC1 family protein
MQIPRLRLRTGQAEPTTTHRRRRTSSALGALILASGLLAGAPTAPATADGSVHVLYAWGHTRDGELGDGMPPTSPGTVRTTPAPVIDRATNVTQIESVLFTSIALHSDGSVWTWGRSDFLGDGGATRSTPGRVPGLPPITQIATGFLNVFALGADGTVWGWGADHDGQLGDGGSDTDRTLPVKAPISGVVRIAVGNSFVLAQKSNGEVWAWGANEAGQLGNGTTTSALTPVRVNLPDGIVQLAAGFEWAMALRDDGSVWTWGVGSQAVLGDGTTANRSTPAPADPRMTGITQISAGVFNAMALAGDGTVWTWGGNEHGEVGDGTTDPAFSPVHLSLSGIVKISVGDTGSTAITSGGRLYYWGINLDGATGLSTASPITQPTLDTRLTGVTTATVSTTSFTQVIFAVAKIPQVPNIVGLNRGVAEAAILSAGLTIGTRTRVPPDPQCLNVGRVVGQNPAAGTSTVPGAKVNFSYVDASLGRCNL